MYIFLRKPYREPTGTWKEVQHCWLLKKCKSKPQWDIISHLSKWLSSKSPQVTNVGEDAEIREPLYTADENVNLCNQLWKTVWNGLKKLKIELSNDLVSPLLGIHTIKTKTLIWKDACPSMFIAALFTIANRWEKSRFILRWKDKQSVICPCNGIILDTRKEWTTDTY